MANAMLAAALPGSQLVDGRVSKASDSALDVPDGAVYLPAVGGRRLVEALDFDIVANSDGTFSSMSVGDDVYVYAVPKTTTDHTAKLVTSLNAVGPDGYADGEYVRIAGLHYGLWRAIADAYNASAAAQTGIIPNSVWDLIHRPRCEPSGMVEITEGATWLDIYLASGDGQAWPSTRAESRHGATPVSGADGYALYYDYVRLLRNANKRLPFTGEWIAGAYGVPQGATGAGSRVSTGQHSDYGFDAVSCMGLDQPGGNLWQTLDDLFDRGDSDQIGNADEWHADDLNAGKDGAEDHGQWHGGDLRVMVMGGRWDRGSEAGARCSYRGNPWFVHSADGCRGACDSL